MKSIIFIDTEVGVEDKKIYDFGAVKSSGSIIHTSSVNDFFEFISGADFLCGHNLIHHDLKYLSKFSDGELNAVPIDTLYLSPLVFPMRPYHRLLKDDKLLIDELNNPVNDSKKAKELFDDEVATFISLPNRLKKIYYYLLKDIEEFKGFFLYIDYESSQKGFIETLKDALNIGKNENLSTLIKEELKDSICENADIESIIRKYPVELAYALALIHTKDHTSVTPPWLLCNFPKIENIIKYLCNTPCEEGCKYCKDKFDVHKGLKKYFGFDEFRTYKGEPLQEKAAQAAVDGKSLIAIFPTGGGKSITFQLPALMSGANAHGLTVVISPLQSLMKDQVDNLSRSGVTEAVTINGLLSPIERKDAFRRIEDGSATLLYISPEMLRSRTIEKRLMARNVVRFVIDEAHCFSAWGHDFRVDYLYIGDFIKKLQEAKGNGKPIPVSCFTATAKQKVINDIAQYFKEKLDLDLEIFASTAARENLHYTVLYKETEEEKYMALRSLIEQKDCPTIVYVSRTKRTRELAEKLTSDGFEARPYNGKMEADEKVKTQDDFISNKVKIIVATSAFGMGVDKKDIKLVIHYDISDSLENYVQEAGRAGRDPSLQAECYVLYNDNDLDKHFLLLNQTKLSISDIQQVWMAIKKMTKKRNLIYSSPLEIARAAGWDCTANADMETRVITAVAALETAGYIKRENNSPMVYATSICVKNMKEASEIINESDLFEQNEKIDASRIMKSLISEKYTHKVKNSEAESRIDYIGDNLGIPSPDVVSIVNKLRTLDLISDSNDMSAFIYEEDMEKNTSIKLEQFAKLEKFVIEAIVEKAGERINLKELNDAAGQAGIPRPNVEKIRKLLYFLTIKGYIQKEEYKGSSYIKVTPLMELKKMLAKFETRIDISRFIIHRLYEEAEIERGIEEREKIKVLFSLVGIYKEYNKNPTFFKVSLQDVEDALLYLSKIDVMKLEGGFLVLYNRMQINRLETDNRIQYKQEDYKTLNEFYKQKIQQIHIVGEFANIMVRDYNAALQFVNDYFNIDFKKFINKYFRGDRVKEINRNITTQKYDQLFGDLSDIQSSIINDNESQHIVVVAGPGSGKTKVLVHKLASLLLLDDIKHEQLLMLTFSRAAAIEFKKRLIDLIGNAAYFVEIKTFHSYAFDLLGKVGNIEGSKNVVKDATQMILDGDVEPGKIAKTVLVIDEAQDMDENEFALIKALMDNNDCMRVVAVGDDDQNIYEFRGSNSKYLRSFVNDYGATLYEMDDNYRSKANIVALSNAFAKTLKTRLKTNDIVPISKEKGNVKLVHHISNSFYQCIADEIISSNITGTSCVLTNTNEEALKMLSVLIEKGVKAKLIQSTRNFKLYDLVEIRSFLKEISRVAPEPVITDEQWTMAVGTFKDEYRNSSCFENCLNLINSFNSLYNIKYKSDLECFIKESEYEDFYTNEKGIVYVSTIHKSKGMEFDSVYLMLNNVLVRNDEEKRKLYVAITRAKNYLSIHYNNDIFDSYNINGVEKIKDCNKYIDGNEIIIQCTYNDINLGSFEGKRKEVFKLRSGQKLHINDKYLDAYIDEKKQHIFMLSQKMITEIENLKSKGYSLYKVEVGFIVAWKNDDDKEIPVILPNLFLRK